MLIASVPHPHPVNKPESCSDVQLLASESNIIEIIIIMARNLQFTSRAAGLLFFFSPDPVDKGDHQQQQYTCWKWVLSGLEWNYARMKLC